jgi:hypothetical protein
MPKICAVNIERRNKWAIFNQFAIKYFYNCEELLEALHKKQKLNLMYEFKLAYAHLSPHPSIHVYILYYK